MEGVIAIMKFIETQVISQRTHLAERIKEKCEELMREGKMPPGRSHGHYKSDMKSNRKFLGWYVHTRDKDAEINGGGSKESTAKVVSVRDAGADEVVYSPQSF